MTFRRILGLFNVKKELAELKDDIAAIQRDKEEWKQTAQLNERYAREAELKIRNLDREKQLLQEKVTALEAVKPAIKPTPASYAHVRQREEELHGLLSLMNTKLEDAKRQSAEHSKILDD